MIVRSTVVTGQRTAVLVLRVAVLWITASFAVGSADMIVSAATVTTIATQSIAVEPTKARLPE